MAGKTSKKTGSARARGLRTLQHQTLPQKTRYAIDTEVWFRGLMVDREPASKRNYRWSTKDQVHDEAIAWFLDTYANHSFEQFPARRTGDEDLTFWIDSKLMERARRMAVRDGVKVARLIDAALTSYVKDHVPEELLRFRQRVQEDACKLYENGGTRTVRSKKTKA